MPRFHCVFVGKTRFPDLDVAIQRYLDRLAHYVPIQVHTVKAEKITPKVREDEVRNRETQRVLKLAGKGSCLVVWDEKGRQFSSVELAHFLDRLVQQANADVWMIMGGALGVSPQLREEAHAVLSLSRMTFPHDMARLLVVEQLYRAFSILRGDPYHK
jgi:23S rRNA (pseudouridine1915-N3)-methyltransferase